jgi:[ribosomal protein S18]-alanine N-acetyltransferase
VSDQERVSILWGRIDDAAELARLHAELFDPSWDVASFEQTLAHPGSVSLVARAGQPMTTVGFIVGQVAADEAEILSIGIVKAWQRRGTGRTLVQAFGRAARNAEARGMHLEVGVGNVAAVSLYRSLGFKESARRKGYYQRQGALPEDAVTMALAL